MDKVSKIVFGICGILIVPSFLLFIFFITEHIEFFTVLYEKPELFTLSSDKPAEVPIMFTRVAKGISMQPTTPGCRQEMFYVKKEPKVGDIVAFKCSTEKCNGNKLKRVIDIKNGCYFMMGDNREHSYDSGDYGYICGDEILIRGVLVGQGACLDTSQD